MIRFAAILLAGLAATPAAADCPTVPEFVEDLRTQVPDTVHVSEVSATVTPTILEWLESEGLPHRADRIVHASGPGGVVLVLITGDRACADAVPVRIPGDKVLDLVSVVRRFRILRGYGPERAA